jgi:hypothetical protein
MEQDPPGADGEQRTGVEPPDPRATVHPDDEPDVPGAGPAVAGAPLVVDGYDDPELLGRGGSATVWRARQRSVDRVVALKVLDVVGVDDASMRRFRNEAAALAQLSWNRHIVHILDAGTTADGRPYLATELVEGGTLAERIERDGPLDPGEVVRIGVGVADALAAAHDAGVLHRDVKPDNVLLDRRGEPRLGDFGLARLTDTTSSTVAGSFGGTVLHAAPELFDGAPPTEASDLWSLGSTLHAAAAGRPPFARPDGGEDSVTSIIRRTLLEEPASLPDSVPAPLAELVLACLRKDPAERPASAAEVRDRLVRLERGDAAPLMASGPGAGARPGSRRGWLVAAAAAAAAAVAAAAVLTAGDDDPQDRAAPARADVAGEVETPTTTAPDATTTTIDRAAALARPSGVSNLRPAGGGLVDTSPELRRRLERFAATSGLAATAGAPQGTLDGELLGLGRPPTTFDYAAGNADRTAGCSRLLIDDLTVVGAAAALWTDGREAVLVNAVQTDDARSARQYYWANALFIGVGPQQCDGWPEGGIAWNPTDLSVQRLDIPLPDGPDLQLSAIDDAPTLELGGAPVDVAYQALGLWGDVVVVAAIGATDGAMDPARAADALGRALAAFGPD